MVDTLSEVTIISVDCGCPIKFTPKDKCSTCDDTKMFVLDGFGADSGRCTVGCAKGYVFEVSKTISLRLAIPSLKSDFELQSSLRGEYKTIDILVEA